MVDLNYDTFGITGKIDPHAFIDLNINNKFHATYIKTID